jgi:zinc-ribbon domain
VEKRFCSNCGNRLEPEARFCSNCGRPVHRDWPPPEADAPTSQLPTWRPPTSQLPPPPQDQPHQAREGIAWHSASEVRGGFSWPVLALAGLFIVVVVVEVMQEGIGGAVRVALVVAAVALVASVISYLSLTRRGEATLRRAVFTWPVVVLAAFAALLFLIS